MSEHSESGTTRPVDELIEELASEDPLICHAARRELTRFGRSVVPQLRDLLRSPSEHVRWEAAKVLGGIGGMDGMDALANALPDPSSDVRWAAVEGLIEGKEKAYHPVLHQLVIHSSNVGVRDAAAHIFASAVREERSAFLRPVLRALRGRAPVFEVSLAAYQALTTYHRAQARLENFSSWRAEKNAAVKDD